MRKLAIAFALSTVALAGLAVYQARELAEARAAVAENPVAAPRRSDAAPAIGSPAAGAAASTPNRSPDLKPPAPADLKTQARAWAVSQIPTTREFLEDPAKRAAALRDNRANFRKEYPRLIAHLGLTDDEYSRLADLLADQQMRTIEARYQCAIKPHCDVLAAVNALEPGFNQEVVALLGPEKKQAFDDYRDNMQERRTVAYLRGELPDSQPLTDAQAERLTTALGDDRRRMLKEWEQRGASYWAGFNARGSIYYSSNAQSVEQRLADAGEYQQRQRARAAQELNAEQLKVFAQMQEDLLDGMRQGWEYEAQSAKLP